MELNLEGIFAGAASLLVIGAFHPVLIWCEYCCGNDLMPRSSLFLDNGCARRYNSIIVS